jgi:3',5'-cyclic AMP phosphodiesterase CpdA
MATLDGSGREVNLGLGITVRAPGLRGSAQAHNVAPGSDTRAPEVDGSSPALDEALTNEGFLRLRVITLDSLVPGSVHGVVSAAQLAWVRSVLARPAVAGSVVVLHHPPIWPDAPDLRAVVLHNAVELGQALGGTDVRAVLCGHLHAQVSGVLNGVPVWVTPGIVTRMDLSTPPHLLRVVKGAGASVVDLGGPFSPMFHTLQARDPQAGELVYLGDRVSGTDVGSEE